MAMMFASSPRTISACDGCGGELEQAINHSIGQATSPCAKRPYRIT
jgi:hypothetical protein